MGDIEQSLLSIALLITFQFFVKKFCAWISLQTSIRVPQHHLVKVMISWIDGKMPDIFCETWLFSAEKHPILPHQWRQNTTLPGLFLSTQNGKQLEFNPEFDCNFRVIEWLFPKWQIFAIFDACQTQLANLLVLF